MVNVFGFVSSPTRMSVSLLVVIALSFLTGSELRITDTPPSNSLEQYIIASGDIDHANGG